MLPTDWVTTVGTPHSMQAHLKMKPKQIFYCGNRKRLCKLALLVAFGQLSLVIAENPTAITLEPYAINNEGVVIGVRSNLETFIFDSGLNTFDIDYTISDINNGPHATAVGNGIWTKVNGNWTRKDPIFNDPKNPGQPVISYIDRINDRFELLGNFWSGAYYGDHSGHYGYLIHNGQVINLDEKLAGSGWSGFSPVSLNNKGSILGTAVKSGSRHAVMLVPVELKQKNYPTTTGATDLGPTEERFISSGTNSIAYITGVPEMPKLEIQIAGGSMSGMSVEWSLDAKSDRDVRGNLDNVHIPQADTAAVVELPISQAWKISDYFIAPANFFGGQCTINYQIKDASGHYLTPILKYKFKILGKNPKDADAHGYIIDHQGNYNYAWAMAQHETRTPSNKVYNQFATANGSSWGDLGQPFFSPKEGNGWGIFQRDGTDGGIAVDTNQVYNWQSNTLVAKQELDQKWTAADRILRYFRNKYEGQSGWEEPPQSYPISNSRFSAWDLATMILYNHVTGCPSSPVTDDNGHSVTVTFPWTFNPNRTPKWKFNDNDENYATCVITHEWEQPGLPKSE